jgi:two-component system, NtrC family, response regulator AtoC
VANWHGRGVAFERMPIMSTHPTSIADPTAIAGFVYGHSPAIQSLNSIVQEVARTNIPVLLMGESGTGKEVYGRLIHRLSGNCQIPLKKLSCRAAEPSEFLAHLKSDLGGNGTSHSGGLRTVFVDGIDELDPDCQKFLVSLLPDGEADENGNQRVRLIASTCRDLEKEIETGSFRRELYFRISGVCLFLPPLRDRREDIPELMEHFLVKHAAELGRDVPVVSEYEMEFLGTHDWPGNVRELENLARKIAVLGNSRKAIEDLRDKPRVEQGAQEERSLSLKVAARAASRQAERDLISEALERTRWNRKRAARDLQISYKSLLYKIKQTGLDGKQRKRG